MVFMPGSNYNTTYQPVTELILNIPRLVHAASTWIRSGGAYGMLPAAGASRGSRALIIMFRAQPHLLLSMPGAFE